LLPAKAPKKAKPKREATFWLLADGQAALLERRPPSGIWGGLYAFPCGEAAPFALPCPPQAWPCMKHAFTHFELAIHPRFCRLPALPEAPGLVRIPFAEAQKLGLPAPVAKLLAKMEAVCRSSPETLPGR
jgi:A/G-specific adenine glycosylase